MRIHRGFLGWGIFLILAGSIPLAVRAGYLSDDQLRNVGSLWPLILVGIGVGLILSRTRYGFLGGFIVAATFGVIVGGVLAGGVTGFDSIGCGPGGGTTAFPQRQGPLTGTTASVEISLSCGDLNVSVAPGNNWTIEGQDRDGTGPNLDADNDSLSIRTRDSNRGVFGPFGDRQTWRITLPDGPGLDTQLTLNAGSSMVNLAGANLGSFEATLNAGSATVDLGSVHQIRDVKIQLNAGSIGVTLPSLSTTGSIEVNAGSVKVCTPPGVDLRLRTDESIVASYDFDGQGLTKNGSTWQTPGYDSAAIRIDLHIQANAGSVSLNRSGGGCIG
jgi:hypothetical protein